MIPLAEQVFDLLVSGPAAIDYIIRSINHGQRIKYTERQVYSALHGGKRQGWLSYERGVWQICGS